MNKDPENKEVEMQKLPVRRAIIYLWQGVLFMACLFFASCRQLNIYEKDVPIPAYAWHNNFVVQGSFDITDTLALYHISLVLRHTDAYRYNNIWLNIGLQPPGDSVHYQKTDLRLGDDAGGWEGSGMNDIWEVRKLLNTGPPQPFRKKGVYRFFISQIMRDEPLQHIMSAGLRVEKATIQ